jgi:hypothetical protein
MWLQIVGKIRLRQSPPINHSWHSTLYLTARGLTTSAMPHGERTFQIDFDFLAHRLIIEASDGASGGFALEPMPVADFYATLLAELARMDLPVRISGRPNEVTDPIPFAKDEVHRSYDADAVQRFWRAMTQAARVFTIFRSRFIGKCSPVHLFWGALDLAVTRFLGPRSASAPRRHPQPARRHHPRGVLARGQQLRVLGPVPRRSTTRRSTRMPTPSPPASARHRCCPRGPSTAATSASSSCPTTSCACQTIRTRRCSRSSSPPTT